MRCQRWYIRSYMSCNYEGVSIETHRSPNYAISEKRFDTVRTTTTTIASTIDRWYCAGFHSFSLPFRLEYSSGRFW